MDIVEINALRAQAGKHPITGGNKPLTLPLRVSLKPKHLGWKVPAENRKARPEQSFSTFGAGLAVSLAKGQRRFRSLKIGTYFVLDESRSPVVCRKTSRFYYTPLSGPQSGTRVRASSNLPVFNVENLP